MTQSIPLSALEQSASAKFETFGDKYVGTITDMKQQQQTDLDNKPKFFESGDPMMLWVITIQPAEGDTVALWAKSGPAYPVREGSGEAMMNAIVRAVKAAGASALEVGAQLAVAYSGESVPKPGMNPAKLFTAQYGAPKPAAQSVPVEDLFSA